MEKCEMRVFVALVAVALVAVAHELCLDTSGPVPVSSAPSQGICSGLGFTKTCCSSSALVSQVQDVFQDLSFQAADTAQADLCADRLKELVCARCDAWGAHLFGAEGTDSTRALPFMCADYCSSVYSACKNVLISSESSSLFNSSTSFRISDLYSSSESFCSVYGPQEVATGVSAFCFSGTEFVPSTPDDSGTDFVNHLCIKPVLGAPDSSIFVFMESVPENSEFTVLGRRSGLIELYQRSASGNTLNRAGVWADFRSIVVENGEKGLLGFAFHPTKSLFYVSYSCSNDRCSVPCDSTGGCNVIPNHGCSDNKCTGQDHISAVDEYSYSFSSGTWSIQFSREIFRLAQPFGNHNGGQVIFDQSSNKSLLMLMYGDGGSGGDPLTSGQTANTYLGKILRVDVDSTSESRNYTIPSDNPFIGSEAASLGFHPEIYAYGLRNPWRCSFDKSRSEYLLCGDVGQNAREEISLITKGGNYGWNRMEGTMLYKDSTALQKAPGQISAVDTPPILEYAHNLNPSGAGHSICGGYFIRGSDMGSLNGAYIYADYRGPLFNARETFEGSGVFTTEQVGWSCANASELSCPTHTGTIYSFAEDALGRVFLLADSGVLEIVPQNLCNFKNLNWNTSKGFSYEAVLIPVFVVIGVIALVGGLIWFRRKGGCKVGKKDQYKAQEEDNVQMS